MNMCCPEPLGTIARCWCWISWQLDRDGEPESRGNSHEEKRPEAARLVEGIEGARGRGLRARVSGNACSDSAGAYERLAARRVLQGRAASMSMSSSVRTPNGERATVPQVVKGGRRCERGSFGGRKARTQSARRCAAEGTSQVPETDRGPRTHRLHRARTTGMEAVMPVLIESEDEMARAGTTVGGSPEIIDALFQALNMDRRTTNW